MTSKRRLGAALLFGGLWLAAVGCGSDALPSSNSGAGGDGGGGSGVGGAGGGGSGVGGQGIGGSGVGGSLPYPAPGSIVASFDSTTEGFTLDNYRDPSTKNLNDVSAPSVPPPTLSWDGSQGSPSPGSLLVTAPFSGANQYVEARKLIGTSAPLDWSKKTLHVRIKVSQGVFKGGVMVFVNTGSAYIFAGTYRQAAMSSGWQDMTVDLTAPMNPSPGYDPAQVVSYGVDFNSGGAGTGSTPVTFSIDSFFLSP